MSSAPTTENKIFNLVLGTAGHIDHGKSSIVRRLTGVDPDRLPEERERKLTIDLGFAPWTLPDGRIVGIIDVPGHERFIKNMVAGATGIDVVLLVVAADDGIMPQTREHLEILSLLEIDSGVVAITKTDLVDAELVEVVALELQDFLAGTFLEDAPVIPVSAHTGDGMDALIEALLGRFNAVEARETSGPFRMPIQRVFSAKGFGTVVTGVPLSGAIDVGETVELLPQAKKGKVRGLQAYRSKVDKARAGHSTAINIPELDWKDVRRGDVICSPGVFQASSLIEVRLHALELFPHPIKNRSTVRFHTGTSEVLGDLILLDTPILPPGGEALCQIRLEEAVVVVPGDRFILRLHSPLVLLGGGTVLGLSQHRLKAGKSFVIERIQRKESAVGDLDRQVVLALQEEPDSARKLAPLARQLNREKHEVEAAMARLVEAGEVHLIPGKGGTPTYLDAQSLDACGDKARDALAAYHAEHPKRITMPLKLLASRLQTEEAFAALLAERHPEIDHQNPAGARLENHEVTHSPDEQELLARLIKIYDEKAYVTPGRADALAQAGGEVVAQKPRQAEACFDWLVEDGQLANIGPDLYLSKERYDQARDKARQIITDEGGLSAGRFKDALETTRKYVIPILEHFDQVGFTLRQGDERVLKEA